MAATSADQTSDVAVKRIAVETGVEAHDSVDVHLADVFDYDGLALADEPLEGVADGGGHLFFLGEAWCENYLVSLAGAGEQLLVGDVVGGEAGPHARDPDAFRLLVGRDALCAGQRPRRAAVVDSHLLIASAHALQPVAVGHEHVVEDILHHVAVGAQAAVLEIIVEAEHAQAIHTLAQAAEKLLRIGLHEGCCAPHC
ncbi:MAG TPA: hypothetical protein VM141_00285 [Planctomycetota bacterium]|nr:hypothetical protein [Planctomycetota bacterium]